MVAPERKGCACGLSCEEPEDAEDAGDGGDGGMGLGERPCWMRVSRYASYTHG